MITILILCHLRMVIQYLLAMAQILQGSGWTSYSEMGLINGLSPFGFNQLEDPLQLAQEVSSCMGCWELNPCRFSSAQVHLSGCHFINQVFLVSVWFCIRTFSYLNCHLFKALGLSFIFSSSLPIPSLSHSWVSFHSWVLAFPLGNLVLSYELSLFFSWHLRG